MSCILELMKECEVVLIGDIFKFTISMCTRIIKNMSTTLKVVNFTDFKFRDDELENSCELWSDNRFGEMVRLVQESCRNKAINPEIYELVQNNDDGDFDHDYRGWIIEAFMTFYPTALIAHTRDFVVRLLPDTYVEHLCSLALKKLDILPALKLSYSAFTICVRLAKLL